jgi:autotransporter-associated beta strand protein
LSIANPLTLNGRGTLGNLSGDNTWTGNINMALFGNPATIDVTADQLTVTGIVSGGDVLKPHELIKQGEGTLMFANANSYVGGTEIQDGVLIATNPSALGSQAQMLTADVQVDAGATLAVQGKGITPVTYAGHSLTLTGTGFDDQGALRSMNGIVNWSGQVTLRGEVAVAADASSVLQFATGLIGGSLDKIGTGELDLLANTPLGMSATPFYVGPTTVLQGTLRISTAGALGGTDGQAPYVSNGTTVFSGATLNIALASGMTLPEDLTLYPAATVQVGSGVTLSGGIALMGTPTISVPTGTAVISGTIAGVDGAGLNVQGPGNLALTANNTYSGPTEVFSGIFLVQGSQPASSVTVDNTAQLSLQGTVGGIQVQPGGKVVPFIAAGATAAGNVNIPGGASGAAATFAVPPLPLTATTILNVPTGSVTLGGNLIVALAATFKSGTTYTLIKNNKVGNLTGIFSFNGTLLQEGNTFTVKSGTISVTFKISYQGGQFGDDVTLTVQ